MKAVLTTIIGLAIAAFATTVSAHGVAITTSIPAVKAADDADLKEALESAIDDAVKHAARLLLRRRLQQGPQEPDNVPKAAPSEPIERQPSSQRTLTRGGEQL